MIESPAGENTFEEEDLSAHVERIRRSSDDRDRGRRKLTKKRERQILKPSKLSREANTLTDARIVRTEGAFFIAQISTGAEIRTKTFKGTQTANPNSSLLAVGDRVKIEIIEGQDALVIEVLERKTKLSRKAAGRNDVFEQVIVSNVDSIVIVSAALEPPFRPGIIDRYILAALEGKLEVLIAINKADLLKSKAAREAIQYYVDLYQSLGYKTFLISTVVEEGMSDLKENIRGKSVAFAGHSGVGKSSIVNTILGEEVWKTGVLSKKYHRGAHTTSATVLIPIPEMDDTFVVDTPGVREFANFELDPENLKFLFAEFSKYQDKCKITNCSHIHEPGCAVLAAVESDAISPERYTSYTKLYEEAILQERKRIDKT